MKLTSIDIARVDSGHSQLRPLAVEANFRGDVAGRERFFAEFHAEFYIDNGNNSISPRQTLPFLPLVLQHGVQFVLTLNKFSAGVLPNRNNVIAP